MSSKGTGNRSWTRWLAILIVAVVYVILIRGFLFAYLDDRGMLAWYGDLIDNYNTVTSSRLGSGPHPLEEYRQRMDILLFQILMLLAIVGAVRYMLRTRERKMIFAINFVLIAVVLFVVEVFLRTDTMQTRIGGTRYVLLDRQITEAHIESQNSLGFTDIERSIERRPNTFRIAVLGDSFVWGDGLEDLADVWSHRLDAALAERYGDSVELISWGKRGWSTFDQLNFLQGDGRDFDIDLLVIGFVYNDPHIRGQSMPRRTFAWNKVLKKSVPFLTNTTVLVTGRINDLLYALPYFENWGYEGWLRALYQDENWQNYAAVLGELQQHLQERNVELLVVITPTMRYREIPKELDRLSQLFEDLDTPYLDLMPAVDREFGQLSASEVREKLWANPADAHPSAQLHALYANETLSYLLSDGLEEKISGVTQ